MITNRPAGTGPAGREVSQDVNGDQARRREAMKIAIFGEAVGIIANLGNLHDLDSLKPQDARHGTSATPPRAFASRAIVNSQSLRRFR
jgi:hypothetical protein